MNNKTIGIVAMKDEGYKLPIENEKQVQKTEFAWWSKPWFIIFLTISMSVLDALVLYDILDIAMTQAEYMGKIVSFGIALILNMMPLLIAKFIHQVIYKTKKGAALWAAITTFAFFLLFASTVALRFAYRDQYGESEIRHIVNEVQVQDVETVEKMLDPKGFTVVLLLSVEPLVTSIVNFFLAYISDDELRERINHLRVHRLELIECEADLSAYLATTEPEEFRKDQLLTIDKERKLAAQDEIHARCDVLKALARIYLAEYLHNPEATSYLTAPFESTDEYLKKR